MSKETGQLGTKCVLKIGDMSGEGEYSSKKKFIHDDSCNRQNKKDFKNVQENRQLESHW